MTDADADNPELAYPTVDDLRWARLARELPFKELDAVRRQAEQWRNAIGGATALFGIAALVRGRNDLTAVPAGWRTATALVLGAAFLALLIALAVAAYASFGRPGIRVQAQGAAYRRWSAARARQIGRLVPIAAASAGLGVILTAAAVGLTWLAPAAETPQQYAVRSVNGYACGELVGMEEGRLILLIRTGSSAESWTVPLAQVSHIGKVVTC
ncbi:hypothetical protein [Streptomyces sp. NPDC001604]|uniref:hypothetical protein n=1 Tax=Streptomyces sp. NPDC001604 TaxID=3364593 RepID=UPI003687BBDB